MQMYQNLAWDDLFLLEPAFRNMWENVLLARKTRCNELFGMLLISMDLRKQWKMEGS